MNGNRIIQEKVDILLAKLDRINGKAIAAVEDIGIYPLISAIYGKANAEITDDIIKLFRKKQEEAYDRRDKSEDGGKAEREGADPARRDCRSSHGGRGR